MTDSHNIGYGYYPYCSHVPDNCTFAAAPFIFTTMLFLPHQSKISVKNYPQDNMI